MTNYYIVVDCDTLENYVFATTNTYALNVRLVDGSNNSYTIKNQVSSTTGYTELTNLVCVDQNGVKQGESGFTTCTYNCPSDLKYVLTRCFGYGGTELTNEDAIALEQRGFNVGDIVYSVDKEVCYTISGTAGSIGNAVYVNIDYKLDSCSMCTNASSDNSSSSGSISSQSPPPPTGF